MAIFHSLQTLDEVQVDAKKTEARTGAQGAYNTAVNWNATSAASCNKIAAMF